ncbi:hypothetical protein PMAYCL1PPCAC_09971, partial [Pristionchus mayeri]
VIDQLRNNLLVDVQEEYNCNLADSSGPVDWSTRGISYPIFGSICVAICCIGIIPYIPCISIIWDMRRFACYKLMFFLAIADICALLGNIHMGVALIYGEMYCHHITSNFIISM